MQHLKMRDPGWNISERSLNSPLIYPEPPRARLGQLESGGDVSVKAREVLEGWRNWDNLSRISPETRGRSGKADNVV